MVSPRSNFFLRFAALCSVAAIVQVLPGFPGGGPVVLAQTGAAPLPGTGELSAARPWTVSALPHEADGSPEDAVPHFHMPQQEVVQDWHWQWVPTGLIYRSYLAGLKEPRFGTVWQYDPDLRWKWDTTIGARVGLLRYGTADPLHPEGWQLDAEGAVFPRLDINDGRRDLDSADFRVGFVLTYGEGPHAWKFGYYHISAHLGDELMLRIPSTPRLNFTWDGLVLGYSYYWVPELRLYAEAAWAFAVDDGAQPWRFQFGVDYAPAEPTDCWGAPFFAINGMLREEVDFGGNLVVQAGWAWRGLAGQLLRMGVQYVNGKSIQYEFYRDFEEMLGFGVWYDY